MKASRLVWLTLRRRRQRQVSQGRSACDEGTSEGGDGQLGVQHHQARDHLGRDVLAQEVDDEDARRDREEAALEVELVAGERGGGCERRPGQLAERSGGGARGGRDAPLLRAHLVCEHAQARPADAERRQELADARLLGRRRVDLAEGRGEGRARRTRLARQLSTCPGLTATRATTTGRQGAGGNARAGSGCWASRRSSSRCRRSCAGRGPLRR